MPGTIAEDLTTDAVISYNGYVFTSACNVLRVTHKPVLDQAKRTVTHTVHTFVLSDILQTVDQTDAVKVDTTTIRRQLLVPGGQLLVQGVGLGSFQVNGGLLNPGAPKDCMWGPIPTELSWENYGNGKAGKITWQVQCATPEQCATPAFTRQPMAYNYEADFSKDGSGYSSRNIQGYIELPLTRNRQTDRSIPDSVDRFREQCYPDVPVGWRRTNDTWKVSPDRRRADFGYTDAEQPPWAPAEGVVSCDQSQSAETDGNNFLQYTTTFTGKYDVAKNHFRAASWNHFLRFVQDRYEAILADGKRRGVQVFPIPVHLRMQEPVNDRTSGSYSLAFRYILGDKDPNNSIFATALQNAHGASGLHTSISEGDWKRWKTSMAGIFNPRGLANTSLLVNPQTDTIIDLCLVQPTPTAKGPVVAVSAAGADRSRPGLKIQTPPPAWSFLEYGLRMRVEDFDTVAELKPLPTQPLQYIAATQQLGRTVGHTESYPNTPVSVIQNRSGSSVAITLSGAALRAGYNITPPVLLKVGGANAIRQNRQGNYFDTWLWGNYGIPIVAAVWSQRYILDRVPACGSLTVPPNPLFGFSGTVGATSGGPGGGGPVGGGGSGLKGFIS